MVAYILKSQTQSSDSWPDAQTGHPHTSDCHRMNTRTVNPLTCVRVTYIRYTPNSYHVPRHHGHTLHTQHPLRDRNRNRHEL